MSTSHKNGRTASKVLKVALSAALAAAFTPMVAAPAFAATTPSEAETVAAIIKAAQDYKYQDAGGNVTYTYTGQSFVDGSTVLTGYTVEEYAGDTSTTDDDGAVMMYDMARFLGALYRNNGEGTTVNAIQFDGTTYGWDESGTLKGSNWVHVNTDSTVTTLVSAITKKIASSAGTTATVNLAVSTDDGKTYHSISLKSIVSTAQIYKDGKKVDGVYSLQSALQAAKNGDCDTIVMTSNAITDASLVLPAGITLNGNGYTLTCLTGNGSGTNAVISAYGDGAVIQNLNIVGPNTTPATTDSNGDVTRTPNEEYAIHASGSGTDLTLKGVTVSRAESAILVSDNAVVTIDGALSVSGNEYEAIELTSTGNLILNSKATVTYVDTAATPFVCSSNATGIENKTTAVKLAKALTDSAEIHYYTSSAPTNGAAYLYKANELGEVATSIALGGKTEYALLKFTPKTSGTYCFASSAPQNASKVADVAAELYTMTANGAPGTKIASGDNEQGENFRVFAKLTGGTSYILRVAISAGAEEGPQNQLETFCVTATQADEKSLDSYVATLPANVFYYSDDAIDASKLNVTAKSSIDGAVLASTKYVKKICNLKSDGSVDTSSNLITVNAKGKYALVLDPAENSGLTDAAFCYFEVLDANDIEDYDFKYNNTLVFASGQVASLTNIAPKGYRYGKSTATFTEANVSVEGWYEVKDGVVSNSKLSTAPSAVGSYVLRLSPVNLSGANTSFTESSTIDLKFSITKGKVTPPAARTGLTYTGSAQQGVPTGASYTLSGTYSATNAGTYSCTATLAEGYSWIDGTTDPKTITWSIAKAKIAVPTGAANLVYTGKAQTGVAAGTGYTLSGTTTATEPGTYSCTATPAANYAWTDGTSTSKTVTWTLGKAPAGITATPSSVVVDAGTKAVVSLKQAGTAAYTVASSNSNVATATVSGSVVTITAKASGSATVTVSTAATARYAAGTCAITVSVPKAEGAAGSVTDTVTNADGTTAKVTNTFKVTKAADPDDADVVPTVAFTGTSASGKFTVPSSVTLADGVTYKVTSIASRAFEGEAVTQVTVPKGVTKIGSYAFRNCKKLTKVTLPSTLKEVGTSAFYGCSKLTSVSVAGGKVGKNAFRNCSRLSKVTLGSKVSSVSTGALKGAKATSITIKTSKLSKTSIKNLVSSSKLTTIKCPGVSKKVKANYSTWAKTSKWNVKVQ